MKTVCHTCMHHCSLEPGQRGLCRARKNEDGRIVCENYGKITSLALDAVEKKPLKLFYPGSRIYRSEAMAAICGALSAKIMKFLCRILKRFGRSIFPHRLWRKRRLPAKMRETSAWHLRIMSRWSGGSISAIRAHS